jgi:hypothetical protein
MFKSQSINQIKKSQTKHTKHTYGGPVLAYDYSATVLVAKMCTNLCTSTFMVVWCTVN